MPAARTVYYWLNNHPEFLQQYELALNERAWRMAEEIIEIADSCSDGWVQTGRPENPDRFYDPDIVKWAKLRIGERKWQMSRMLSKRHCRKAMA